MFRIFLILACVRVLIIKCEPSLLILKNINNIEEPLHSNVLVTNKGKILSLTCKTIDVENQNSFDNLEVWSRKTKNLRFQNKNGTTWTTGKKSTNLNFTPVMLQDRGTYFCTNNKYNLSRRLHLIVRSDKPAKAFQNSGRRKRDIEIYHGNISYDSPYHDSGYFATYKPFEFPDTSWYKPTYQEPDSIDKMIEDLKRKSHPENEGNKDWTALYVVFGMIGVTVIIALIYFCTRQWSKEPPYVMRRRLRNANPSPGCTMGAISSSNGMPAPVQNNDYRGPTMLTSLITPADTTHLSVSPSHANSTRNSSHNSQEMIPSAPMRSSCDLPPSYDDALADATPSAPPCSTTTAEGSSAPPDVTKSTSSNKN